jgi:hypothetical protein
MLNEQPVSKALMLKMLEKHQKGFVIDPFLTFSVQEWRHSPQKELAKIRQKNLGPVVIVRSAALTEDSEDSMPPGTYHTELNVPVESEIKLSRAIEKVIASYQRDIHDGGVNELN